MATLKKILDAVKAPNRKVWVQDLKTLFLDNPAAIHLETYGARNIAGGAPGHNHSSDGGELIRGSLLSVALGPWLHEGTAGASYVDGIPVTRNSTYPTSPKLMLSALTTIPGGVSRLRGALLIATGAASGSITLSPVLRATQWANFKLVANALGVYATTDLVLTANGSNYYLLSWSWEVADLLKVKNPNVAARCEFALFQKTTSLGAAPVEVLGFDLWIDDDPTPTKRGPQPSDPPLSEVTYADILTGKILLTTLARKLRGRLNAGIHGVLGRAPGLGVDAVVVDRDTRWSRKVKTAHSHRGVLVPTGRGDFIADGACLTYPSKAVGCWPRYWGEDASALRNAPTSQVQGKKIHSGGALDATWLSWDFDIDLESGQGALVMQCGVEPGNTDDNGRLLIHVGVYTRGGSTTNLVKSIKSDYHNQESVDAGGLLVCEVEPEENDAWQPNQNRRLSGKGVYTQNAKKTASTASTLVQTTNAYRVSKPIIVGLSHPAYQADGEARKTGRHILRVRFSLPSGTAYDASARVLAFEATGAAGY